MKKLVFCFSFALLLINISFAIDNPWETRLPFKSGLITYKLAGSMQGKKVLYITDYGRTRAEYSKVTVSMMGINNTESTTEITTPDWVYTIDNTTKSGIKEVNPSKYFIEEFEKLSDADKEKVVNNLNAAGSITVGVGKGEFKKKADKVLGYDCDMVSMMGTSIYMFTGTDIPLKTVGNTMGIKISEAATSIKLGNPPAKAFALPKINFETDSDNDGVVKQQAHDIIQGLIEGKSMADIILDDETDSAFQDDADFPFGDEMTDEQAIQFRTQQAESEDSDTDDVDQEEAAKQIQKGLTNMFKNMF